jgi:putative membrane protein
MGAVAVLRVMLAATAFVALPVAAHLAAHDVSSFASARVGQEGGVPWIAAALCVTGIAYAAGLARLWLATAPGRGIRVREACAFAGGWLSLALALLGPLDRWAERSFAAHMLQHEILMLVAAPLLVIGRPLAAWTWALPRRARRGVRRALASAAVTSIWRALTRPLGATVFQLAVLFVLHVPLIFDYAATHAGAHAAQHALFLASALCFWWATRGRAGYRSVAGEPGVAASLACLFVTMLATGALGALLTFASTPWYPIYAPFVLPWSGDATADQQLGGLLMWIPGGSVYLVAALARARELLVRGPASSACASHEARDAGAASGAQRSTLAREVLR